MAVHVYACVCVCASTTGEKVWKGKSIFCQSERDVFQALDLKYVPPRERNCYDIIPNASQEGENQADTQGSGAASVDSEGEELSP